MTDPSTTTTTADPSGRIERDVPASLHEVLLHIAGRAPDDLLTTARGWLAGDRHLDVARAVAFAVLTYRVPVREEDLMALADVLSGGEIDPSVLGQADVAVNDIAPPFLFQAEPPAAFADPEPAPKEGGKRRRKGRGKDVGEPPVGGVDPIDQAAVEAVAGPGVRGLWCAWRLAADGSPWPAPRRVYVLEVELSGERPVAAAHLQRALAEAGEHDPQVEVYATNEDLPSYQRLARAGGSLVWAASPDREVRVAATFDEVNEEGTPSFDPDHSLVPEGEDRHRFVRYLNSGAPLLVTTSLGPDLVDEERGSVVPMNFRTDGVWIWCDAMTYYLDQHGLAPEADLVSHLRDQGEALPEVDGVDIHRAIGVLSS